MVDGSWIELTLYLILDLSNYNNLLYASKYWRANWELSDIERTTANTKCLPNFSFQEFMSNLLGLNKSSTLLKYTKFVLQLQNKIFFRWTCSTLCRALVQARTYRFNRQFFGLRVQNYANTTPYKSLRLVNRQTFLLYATINFSTWRYLLLYFVFSVFCLSMYSQT